MPGDRLALDGGLEVGILPGEGVLLVGDGFCKVLQGDAYERVLPLIDGLRNADDIVDALAGAVAAERVHYVLERLRALECLATTADHTQVDNPAWTRSPPEIGEPQGSLPPAARVALTTLGTARAAPLRDALAGLGLDLVAPLDADVWVVAADDYLDATLARVNRAALATGRPWLLLRTTVREFWIGPLFKPGNTGCWACLARRLRGNDPARRFLHERAGSRQARRTNPAPGAAHAAAARGAAAALARFLAGSPGAPIGTIQRLEWETGETSSHVLVRNPHCSACGTRRNPQPSPLRLRDRAIAYALDGGYRSVTPEETLRRYGHHVSPITGVVRALVPVRSDPGIAHVYVAGHNPALPLERLDDLRRCLRHASAGKGLDEAQARASALGEALERHSGEFTGDEPRVRRALRDWPAGTAIHPNQVMRFSDRQLAERDAWNARGSRFNRVPVPLPDDKPVDWSPLWSLSKRRHVHLPTQLLYHRAPAAAGDATVHAIGCSNGCAAGNSLEEAILQGLLELVERDAVAIWWYNRLVRPPVAVGSFDDPQLLAIQKHTREQLGRETWALDLTHDLGIPVFAAVSRLADASRERPLFGFGCHLDPRLALRRAFAELHQMLGMSQPEDARALGIDDRETLDWLENASLANQPQLAPDAAQEPLRLVDFAAPAARGLLDDIERCRAVLEGQGMDVLVLDQTRADIGMPVVKVVVPGLRHFSARFAPGRLYEVPVTMEWRSVPTPEAALNPVWMFL